MQSLWQGIFACAFVVAGSVYTSESMPEQIRVPAGTDVPTRVQNYPHAIQTCVLHAPNGLTIQLMPEDQSNDKFQLDPPSFLYHCRVTIKNVDENDNGRWELMYTGFEEDNEEGETKEVTGSQFYDIIVTPRVLDGAGDGTQTPEEGDTETSTETHLPDIITSTLTRIDFGARKGTEITFTLSRKTYTEECYLTTPSGEVVNLEDVQMEGVQVYPAATNFVSCRVVIGPMEDNLLGHWSLCGRHSNGLTTEERCQPGNIAWAIRNPEENWDSRVEPRFEHPVHFGGQVTTAVRGTGTANTCHAITPTGEDIALLDNSDYPGLTRTVTPDVTLCTVTIANIDVNYLGSWTVYGTFSSNFNSGFKVVSQPMTFFLYDEENPHNQAYNVTLMEEKNVIINMGGHFNVSVSGGGTRLSCEVRDNSGEIFDWTTVQNFPAAEFVDAGDTSVCRLRLGPITSNMLGKWILNGKFTRNNVLFNEIQQPFHIFEEDPVNPVDDPRFEVTYLAAQEVITKIGDSVTFTTEMNSLIVRDSCHLRTPDNRQYILSGTTVIGGVEYITSDQISCGVLVHVDRESNIGDWMLIARIARQDAHIEWRLPFTIRAEEFVTASPNVTTIVVGSDLYLRLENPTPLYNTCTIVGPNRSEADRDENFIDTCGFIVHNVNHTDSGIWEIVYGSTIKYRARVDVNVNEIFTLEDSQLEWSKDASVNLTIGPEDSIFCRVENPAGVTVSEGFGRCNIAVDRVRTEHEGIWTLFVGTAGKVLTEQHKLVVKLSTPVSKHQVSTSVIMNEPAVMISCKVPSDLAVTACKFRDPTGKVLLAAQGIGEERYSFHGTGVSLESNASDHECGLRITNPVVEEIGIWRCALDTDSDVFYGFFTVIFPWAPSTDLINTEPVLRAEMAALSVVAGDEVTMKCTVPSPIQYCYFRTRNGTVYNIGPGGSEWYDYAGSGLDAGECSIWFPNLQAADSGIWSCHVGFYDPAREEQRANIDVYVEDAMVARQYTVEDGAETLVVQSQVHGQRAIEYCRFVRIDGLGFKSDHMPSTYEDHSLLTTGHCEIRIPQPSIIEKHPWTIVTRIVGQDVEVSRVTEHSFAPPEEIETPVEPSEEHPPIHPDNNQHFEGHHGFMMMWSIVLVISMVLFFLGLMLGPKKNRKWTHHRAEIIRTTFRNSFIKKPLPGTTKVPNHISTPSVA